MGLINGIWFIIAKHSDLKVYVIMKYLITLIQKKAAILQKVF